VQVAKLVSPAYPS